MVKAMSGHNYLICTHPRSGSNYFCELLSSTGELGHPADYFHEGHLQLSGLTSSKKADLEAQLTHVMQATPTANGVVGIKLFFFDVPALQAAGIMDRLSAFRCIFLQRRDKLAQAISIRKTLMSGQLTSHHAHSGKDADYDYDDIRLRIVRTLRAEQGWRAFFRTRGIQPFMCCYEDLAETPRPIIDKVATFVGLSKPVAIQSEKLTLQVQRDASSREWHARFLVEAGRRDPELQAFCAARMTNATYPEQNQWSDVSNNAGAPPIGDMKPA